MDELLLRRAQDGDPEAFTRLMTPLEGLVWRVCWHYMGEKESASDCGQEAMVRIWRNLKSYRADCAFESWVYRVCANCCLDALRKRKRENTVSIEPMKEQGFDPPDSAPGTEEQAVKNDEQARLRACIAALPEEQREALILTQLEGRSYEETAALLGVNEGTVKSRVNRARTRLKELFTSDRELSGGESVQRDERRIRS